jgi:UPF0716 family protein affecting phage T7 exclusion
VVRAVLTFEQARLSRSSTSRSAAFFATFVFAISVVALPLMLDRKTDAITAAIASLVACGRSPATMMLWAACIVFLVAMGFATFFFGLLLIMPLVGHATWHAYRDLVQLDDHRHDAATRFPGQILLRQAIQKIEVLQPAAGLAEEAEPAIMDAVDLAAARRGAPTRD